MKRFRRTPSTRDCELRAEIARRSLRRSAEGGEGGEGEFGSEAEMAGGSGGGRDGRVGLEGPSREDEDAEGCGEGEEGGGAEAGGLARDERKSTGIRVCCLASAER